jgi:hypothetical protein
MRRLGRSPNFPFRAKGEFGRRHLAAPVPREHHDAAPWEVSKLPLSARTGSSAGWRRVPRDEESRTSDGCCCACCLPMATFRPHASLQARVRLRGGHFERWLWLWRTTVDDLFAGERAELAKAHAQRVAQAFLARLQAVPLHQPAAPPGSRSTTARSVSATARTCPATSQVGVMLRTARAARAPCIRAG